MTQTKMNIKKIIPQTPNSSQIILDIDQKTKDTYQIPGQYAIISADDHKDGFFAFCQKPKQADWSFLIKESSPLTSHLLNLKKGDELTISPAQGKGYDTQKAFQKNIVLLAVGSGIGPIKALIEYLIEDRENFKNIELYYGCRHPEDFAFQDDFKTWTDHDIQIVQTISNHNLKEWPSNFGYVQDHLKDLSSDSIAYICGMNEMMKASQEKLLELSLTSENILTNY